MRGPSSEDLSLFASPNRLKRRLCNYLDLDHIDPSKILFPRMNSNNRQHYCTFFFAIVMIATRQFSARVIALSSVKVTLPRRSMVSLSTCRHIQNDLYRWQNPVESARRRFSTYLFESMDEGGENEVTTGKKTTWNVGGLQKEVSRLTVRCHKKIGKARERLDKANQEVERLVSDPDVSYEELEKCPNIDELTADVKGLQTRLQNLNKLEVRLVELGLKGKAVVLPDDVSALAIELDINDTPPPPQEKVTKKEKGPRTMESFRLPYRRYYSENKTEIRVGKQAEDNDELTLSPQHRDSADWWMHASGCPGSHVIIRSHDQNLNEEVVKDAAALAARQSKCTGNVIKVSMTRARDIKKPPGAKAGLVQLTGQIRTVAVNMKEAEVRLNRLDKTVLVN